MQRGSGPGRWPVIQLLENYWVRSENWGPLSWLLDYGMFDDEHLEEAAFEATEDADYAALRILVEFSRHEEEVRGRAIDQYRHWKWGSYPPPFIEIE
jgi:hypothetical protein